MSEELGTGKRYNSGKVRHELMPSWSMDQIAKVFTFGASKYGEKNWEKGMKWSTMLASAKRHLNAIERGEDFDPETGLLHASHLGCNILMLHEYYKIYPQGDDREHHFLRNLKIGLDIDGVLADFDGAFKKRTGSEAPTHHWQFSYSVNTLWKEIVSDKSFWLNMKPLMDGAKLPFEPHCYVTARPIPSEWTMAWLEQHGFPCMPVYTVGDGASKVDVLKNQGVDIYVDDSFKNFAELNKAGIFTYLYDRPYNRKHDVGHRRIKSLSEL